MWALLSNPSGLPVAASAAAASMAGTTATLSSRLELADELYNMTAPASKATALCYSMVLLRASVSHLIMLFIQLFYVSYCSFSSWFCANTVSQRSAFAVHWAHGCLRQWERSARSCKTHGHRVACTVALTYTSRVPHTDRTLKPGLLQVTQGSSKLFLMVETALFSETVSYMGQFLLKLCSVRSCFSQTLVFRLSCSDTPIIFCILSSIWPCPTEKSKSVMISHAALDYSGC